MDPSASAPNPGEPPELAAFGLRVGSTLAGKYVLEGVIGSGGMSVVVRAKHTLLGQDVALKLLRPELASDPTHVERFLREALAAAQLKNEHVVRILDADRLPDGVPYLVMESLQGVDLAQLLAQRGPLPPNDVVYYLLQACEAVAEAHGRGIVHRDIKPSNLFLTTTSEGAPSVKVLDFGISKLDSTDADLRLTGTMVVLGSPLHMSPEQIRDSRTVDRRTDIWSLGTLAFELLAGRPPFLADTASALIAKISADQPDALSKLRPDVAPELESVLMRCLEKDRTRRIQSVDELVRLLAPLAPPEAQTHIDRALRIAQGNAWALRVGETQQLSAGELAPESKQAELASAERVGGRTRRVDRPQSVPPEAVVSAAAPAVAAPSPKGSAVSVVGWGTTHRAAVDANQRSRRRFAVGGGVLVLAAAAGSALWWWERPAPDVPAEPSLANAVAGGVSGLERAAAAPQPESTAAADAAPIPPPPASVAPRASASAAQVTHRAVPSVRPARKPAVEKSARPRSAPNPSMFEERR